MGVVFTFAFERLAVVVQGYGPGLCVGALGDFRWLVRGCRKMLGVCKALVFGKLQTGRRWKWLGGN